jgi:transposase
VEDFVASDDPVRVLEQVVDSMSHDELVGKYSGGGAPAYDPVMMIKVIVFGYCEGVRSSRKLDAALGRDLRFMFIAQMSRPDFRTIARFRRDNVDALRKAFEQTVRLSQQMGLVVLDHVCVDGTKLEANVSGKHTYKKERLNKALVDVDKRIEEILEEAERVDAEEDRLYGNARGDELPKELADANRRKELLEKAKRHLEATGRETVCATDLESRVMKTRSGNRPAYNAQAVVDRHCQIIVAADVSQEESDNHQLPAMIQQTQELTGAKPGIVTIDGGYFSNETLVYADETELNIYVPDNQAQNSKAGFAWDAENDKFICPCGHSLKYSRTRDRRGRVYRVYRHSCSGCEKRSCCCGPKSRVKELWLRVNGELEEKMRAKMGTDEAKAIYRLRKQIVEPVFGDIKENKKMRRLLLRGVIGATIEFMLGCISHNMGKIIKFGPNSALQLA